MADRAHPGLDAYIQALPAWQQEVCRDLRDLIWRADAEIEETIKRSVQPYFVLEGNVCALLAATDHVNLFLYDPTVPDPDGLINHGHGNATARAHPDLLRGLPQRQFVDPAAPGHRGQQPRRRVAATRQDEAVKSPTQHAPDRSTASQFVGKQRHSTASEPQDAAAALALHHRWSRCRP